MYSFRRPKKGFTLIEMLVVIAIISILVSIIIPTVGASVTRAAAATNAANLRAIEGQLTTMRLMNPDAFKTEQEWLEERASEPVVNFFQNIMNWISPGWGDAVENDLRTATAVDGVLRLPFDPGSLEVPAAQKVEINGHVIPKGTQLSVYVGEDTLFCSYGNYNKEFFAAIAEGQTPDAPETGGGSGTCIAEGTLVTMADGTKCAVEDLRKGDMVMAFDHMAGRIIPNEVIIVIRTASDFYRNTFLFDDGTQLATINEHGIYDLELNRYVNISHENADAFIGHRFVAVDSDGNLGTKKLVDVASEFTSGYKYDIVTDQTLNYVAEDTLSVTHVLVDVINTFAFDGNMCYDQQKMQEDIARYGLSTYAEWEEYCDITVFEQYNGPFMKVGISKGLYTGEYIINLINTYVLNESVQLLD